MVNVVNWKLISDLTWVIGIPIIVWLLVKIVRRSREISQRIAELREEEARNAANPYSAMARMYEAQQLLEDARSSSKGAKRQRTGGSGGDDVSDGRKPR